MYEVLFVSCESTGINIAMLQNFVKLYPRN